MSQEPVEILLVEDNRYDVELTLYALKKSNLTSRIQVVRDGSEALDFLFARGDYAFRDPQDLPRLILLDLKLPKVDGVAVLRSLKAEPATRAIPVVILSSSRESRDLEECYALGVNSYILKPVEFEQFTDCVWQMGLYWLSLNQAPVIS